MAPGARASDRLLVEASRTCTCLAALVAALLAPVLGLGANAQASVTRSAAVPGELIVKFSVDADARARAAARVDADVQVKDSLPLPGLQLVKTDPGQSARAAATQLERSPGVLYAEPNLIRHASAVPNDTYFGDMWGTSRVQAPEAWDMSTGSPHVTSAVIDSGVDSTHPDLSSRIDRRGWDFVDDDNLPADENGHGTHVAGTIAAQGNNGKGIVGVSWNSRVMPLRVLDANGSGTLSDVILAYRHATREGVRVVNLSLGGSAASSAERDAIAAAPRTLFVVAAGNDGRDVDRTPQYPCAYPAPNVICVAASGRADSRAGFSNYGARSVDLAAPGEHILSTVPGGYSYYDGTSMATPHVAGAAVLLLSLNPSSTVAQVKADLLAGADRLSAFSGTTSSGARLNVLGALRRASDRLSPPGPAPSAPETRPSGDRTAPRLSVRGFRQRLRSVLSRGLLLRLRCSERCSVRLRLKAGRTRVGTTRLGVSSRGRRVTIKLSKRGRRILRSRNARLTIDAAVRDGAGNAGHRAMPIAVRR